jgi:hypothetical protein
MSFEQPPDFFLSNEAECRKLGIDSLDVMFPEHDNKVALAIGKSVCDGCLFQEPCFDYGMSHLNEVGLYGGYDDVERRYIHRKKLRAERQRQ